MLVGLPLSLLEPVEQAMESLLRRYARTHVPFVAADPARRWKLPVTEVESALLTHAAVAECGVVGCPDEERGQIVKAYVVLRAGMSGDAAMTKTLQDHVKATVAPYKYPRAIEFVTELPKTQTGKLQRFELRRRAAEGASRKLAS